MSYKKHEFEPLQMDRTISNLMAKSELTGWIFIDSIISFKADSFGAPILRLDT